MITGGFLLIFSKTDLFLLGLMQNEAAVGLYAAGLQTAHIAMFGATSVDAIAAPSIAVAHARRDTASLRALARRVTTLYLVSTIPLAVLVFAAAPWILALFGPSFAGSTVVVYILLGGLLVNAAAGPQRFLLTMTGHERLAAGICGVSALLNIAFNAVGIYFFGVVGAATATACSIVCMNAGLYAAVRHRLHVDATLLALSRSRPH
jgi:O-antigen/teichoic acid export membrane protein